MKPFGNLTAPLILPEHICVLCRVKSALYYALAIVQNPDASKPEWSQKLENQNADHELRVAAFILTRPAQQIKSLVFMAPEEIRSTALAAVAETTESERAGAFQILCISLGIAAATSGLGGCVSDHSEN
jgi:hypothetical protein